MNTKQVITTLGITALLSTSTAWADSATNPSQQQITNKVSDCSQLKYPQLHSNVCEGAQRFADGVNEIAKKIIPGAFSTSGSKFTFYEQAPDKPAYMLISYPTGPKTQCTVTIKPLDKKTSYQQFTDICKRINN
ncbi:MAG: hypothetical protein P1U40_12860 [Coxiellaceae bacterium]|nr:hypothetical protein [Coxiellaceae bacterium]